MQPWENGRNTNFGPNLGPPKFFSLVLSSSWTMFLATISSNIKEVIRAVLNFLFFLRKDFPHTKGTKGTKRTQGTKGTKSTKIHIKTPKSTKSTKTQSNKSTKMQISEQK